MTTLPHSLTGSRLKVSSGLHSDAVHCYRQRSHSGPARPLDIAARTTTVSSRFLREVSTVGAKRIPNKLQHTSLTERK